MVPKLEYGVVVAPEISFVISVGPGPIVVVKFETEDVGFQEMRNFDSFFDQDRKALIKKKA